MCSIWFSISRFPILKTQIGIKPWLGLPLYLWLYLAIVDNVGTHWAGLCNGSIALTGLLHQWIRWKHILIFYQFSIISRKCVKMYQYRNQGHLNLSDSGDWTAHFVLTFPLHVKYVWMLQDWALWWAVTPLFNCSVTTVKVDRRDETRNESWPKNK